MPGSERMLPINFFHKLSRCWPWILQKEERLEKKQPLTDFRHIDKKRTDYEYPSLKI